MKGIRVTVSKNGKIVIQPFGFTGPACHEATRAIEEALGRKVASENTADFYADGQVSGIQQDQ